MSLLLVNRGIETRFGRYTLITGVLLTVLGMVGIFLPNFIALGADIFIASLMIVGGTFWAMHTIKYSAKHVMDWIKPMLLLVSGGLMIVYPITGIATVGFLLAVYLLMDAYSSFMLGQSMYPTRGWGWMVFNGVISLILALLFLIGWPETSLWLVGLYIAISLFFDGTALLAFGLLMKKS